MPGRVEVPSEFKVILQDFTVNYLIAEPLDVVNFALDYFNDLKRKGTPIIWQTYQNEAVQDEDETELFNPPPQLERHYYDLPIIKLTKKKTANIAEDEIK